MHRTLLVLTSLACMTTAACSSSSTGAGPNPDGGGGDTGGGEAGCTAYVPDAGLTSPTVGYAKDVAPIFQQSCAIAGATCHGATGVASQGRPYLGLFDGGADASQVIGDIVGIPSTENPQMSIVKASDPANSYLMHKLDWDECMLAAQCAKGASQYPDCGQGMPYSSPQLDPATRDTVRRWIAQGAKNN